MDDPLGSLAQLFQQAISAQAGFGLIEDERSRSERFNHRIRSGGPGEYA